MTSKSFTYFARALSLVLIFLLAFEPVVWAAPSITYLHNDIAGSPVAATDESGNVVWHESYRPYGDRIKNEAASSTNRQFYHGKPLDTDTGLSYFGARYYDPVVGRFMGTDPNGFDEANIHSFNSYAYGNNNPLKYRDPDGNFAILDVLFLATITYLGLVAYTHTVSQHHSGDSSSWLQSTNNDAFGKGNGTPLLTGHSITASGSPDPDDKSGKNNRVEKRQEKINQILRDKKLPTSGEVSFEPPKNWNPSEPLRTGEQDGFIDKFGREWTKGPSRTPGQHFEWDVQLKDGSHLNVDWFGKITH